MASKRKRKKPLSLAAGRPPKANIHKPTPTLSSRTTRTLIRTHHTLQKQLARAEAAGDTPLAEELQAQVEAQGGLRAYQVASIHGQASERGGDSSRVMVDWLKPVIKGAKCERELRMLEVGALSCRNACARSGLFRNVTRIDLHSQDKQGILTQDFMARPLPADEGERFEVVSLSLVLNYVPDSAGRGEMLKRTTQFLSDAYPSGGSTEGGNETLFPSLFLVLPLPCVANSRYMDEGRLTEMMRALGYSLCRRKLSSKLAYYLWLYDASFVPQDGRLAKTFKKTEVNPGRTRNNFAIVLE
ncbi:MAG: hypothetical protein M1832_004726 [Thelocarpon impressellum]|nr:MAG: hypothetical protein M1832_004726 [Thelocarpon impressellum]